VLLSTAKYGAGLSSDSVAYLDVARSLVAGKGFVFHTGEPLVWWPPLYPMLLALVGFATGLDPGAFAHLVNAVLFALVIGLSARLFQTSFPQNITYSLLGTCAVLVSMPLSEVYGAAWSECLFIPLVLLYLISAQRYWESGGLASLAVMVLSTALACLTRYIGVVLVLAGIVTIALTSGMNFKDRFARASAFAVLSFVPLGLWFLRNHQLTGTLAGSRGPSTLSFTNSVILSARTMLSWYAFGLVSVVVVIVWIAGLTYVVLRPRTAVARLSSSLKAVLSGHSPAVLLLVTYTVMLSMAATHDAFVESRTLSPIFVPLTLVLLILAHHLLAPTRLPSAVLVRKVPATFMVLWLCLSFASVARSAVGRFRNGAGSLNSRKWRESATVAYAKQMKSTKNDLHVCSNGTDALWELARVNATELPIKSEVNLSDLRGRWPPESVSVLVWFNNRGWREQYYSVKELGQVANVEEVARLGDGSVYQVSVRDTAAPY
jgi:hypothetical protein